MQKIFISYDHDDLQHKQDIESINHNLNNFIKFIDWSLSEPVYNAHNDVNRRSPHDIASNSVNNKIHQLLSEADKLLVLIGNDTHSSLWVKWEVETFIKLHGAHNTLLMRVKGNTNSNLSVNLPVQNWNMRALEAWLQR